MDGILKAGYAFPDSRWEIQLSGSMLDLQGIVHRQVVENLAKYNYLIKYACDKMAVLRYDIECEVYDDEFETSDIGVTQQMIESIDDLFNGPGSVKGCLIIVARLRWSSGKDVISDGSARESLELAGLLVQRPETEIENDYFRIGTHRPSEPEGVEVADASESSESKKIPVVQTLVGYYNKSRGRTEQAIDLRIRTVRAWDFGGYCIGDPSSGQPHAFIDQGASRQCGDGNDVDFLPFGKARDLDKLHDIAVEHLETMQTGLDSGVPFMRSTHGMCSIRSTTSLAISRRPPSTLPYASSVISLSNTVMKSKIPEKRIMERQRMKIGSRRTWRWRCTITMGQRRSLPALRMLSETMPSIMLLKQSFSKQRLRTSW